MSDPRYWFNGDLLPADAIGISPFDRGLLLGDGVFETIRAYDGRVFRLADHLARLAAGAAVLDIPLPPGLEEALTATLTANRWRDAVLRLTVTRGATPPDRGGLLLPTPPPPTVLITGRALVEPPYPARCYDPGLRVVWAGPPRNEHSPLSRCKTLNYGDQILLRQAAARAGADDGLQCNTAGAVVGASVANLFLVRAGTLITPSLESGCLPGVTRAVVLDLAAALSIPCAERIVLPEEVAGAAEVFLTNTLLEIAPVTRLDDRSIGAHPGMGPLTARLAAAFTAYRREGV